MIDKRPKKRTDMRHDTVREKAKAWLEDPQIDDDDKKEIKVILEEKNYSELEERFYRDLEFGTGGMRGIIGAGTNRINKYVIRKIIQGFSSFLKNAYKGAPIKIAIAFDSRRYSQVFAKEAASVLAGNGIQSFIFSEPQATPILSYSIRALKCHGGICVTASHNPANYNGIKLYDKYGGQIIPPEDKDILQMIKSISSLESVFYKDFNSSFKEEIIKYVPIEVFKNYLKLVKSLRLKASLKNTLKIVYTPLHGAGYMPVSKSLEHCELLPFYVVESQKQPNSEFPTVKKPNPEEPKALEEALKFANNIKADAIFANDPDADRMALAVSSPLGKSTFKHRLCDGYVFLSGNQIASLLLDYILRTKKSHNTLKKTDTIIKTIVTSDLQNCLARKYNLEIIETLTGFKWIAGILRQWEEARDKNTFLYASEESIGFLITDKIRDKDGVSVIPFCIEFLNELKDEGSCACKRLCELYSEHGVWEEELICYEFPGQKGMMTMEKIMTELRENPLELSHDSRISTFIDFKDKKTFTWNGSSLSESKMHHDLPSSNVVQFIFEDKTKVTFRPSGTEPKLKIYISSSVASHNIDDGMNKVLSKINNIKSHVTTFLKAYS